MKKNIKKNKLLIWKWEEWEKIILNNFSKVFEENNKLIFFLSDKKINFSEIDWNSIFLWNLIKNLLQKNSSYKFTQSWENITLNKLWVKKNNQKDWIEIKIIFWIENKKEIKKILEWDKNPKIIFWNATESKLMQNQTKLIFELNNWIINNK